MASPTDLARGALDEVKVLKAKLNALEREMGQYEFMTALHRLTVVEERLQQIARTADDAKRVPVIDDRAADADALREQVAVLKAEMVESKKSKEQNDSRVWNVLMIAVGAVLSLLGGVVVQLIAFTIKK